MANTETASGQGVTFIVIEPEDDGIRESPREQFDEVMELASTIDPPLLVIDLKEIHYVSSSFVAFLLRLSNRIAVQRHGRFGICHLTPYCEHVLKSCRLHEFFDLFETREHAIAAFGTGGPSVSALSPRP